MRSDYKVAFLWFLSTPSVSLINNGVKYVLALNWQLLHNKLKTYAWKHKENIVISNNDGNKSWLLAPGDYSGLKLQAEAATA